MIDLLAVYVCPHCGDVLEDECEDVEIIDIVNDDVWDERICNKCHNSVRRKEVETNGKKYPCFQTVDHERWLWATGFYDDLLNEDWRD